MRRLREDRRVGRTAAAAERTAATVEQRERDVVLAGPLGDLPLCLVERERRADRADVLRGVRVAEHDLEPTTGGLEPGREVRIVDDLREDSGGRLQVGEGLEQGDDVEHRGSAVRPDRGAGQAMHVGQIVRRLRERDDVATGCARPVALLDLRDRPHDLEGLLRHIAERLTRRADSISASTVR